ncbi:MAG: hypothetical protein ACLTLQ_08725 [[Clostridium] scindens]
MGIGDDRSVGVRQKIGSKDASKSQQKERAGQFKDAFWGLVIAGYHPGRHIWRNHPTTRGSGGIRCMGFSYVLFIVKLRVPEVLMVFPYHINPRRPSCLLRWRPACLLLYCPTKARLDVTISSALENTDVVLSSLLLLTSSYWAIRMLPGLNIGAVYFCRCFVWSLRLCAFSIDHLGVVAWSTNKPAIGLFTCARR